LPDAIKVEIERLQTEIAAADAEDAELAGGLIKTLIKLRAATLRQTKAMLEQKAASLTFGIAVSYTIDGKALTLPEDRAKELERIRGELSTLQDKIASQEAEVQRYSGGLVQAMAHSTLATMRQTRAMLDQRRLALEYELPQFVGFENDSTEAVGDTKEETASQATPVQQVSQEDRFRFKDYRNADWGMSRADVIHLEGREPDQTRGDIIGYNATIAGLKVLAGYVFADDQLVRGKYVLLERHTNKNQYIADFEKLADLLSEKYGESKKEVYWKNNLYRDDADRHGMAISAGHVTVTHRWNTERTNIILGISGDNFEISVGLEYTSKSLGHLEDEATQKKTLDVL
jgi:hypothetical protein